ncbi:MAG: flagellar motor protein MotB [Fidelibacterota bacterium]|nr:MAG: flagellar motor protein MotB [Candidatus Neomarinimicrobiota bacterium]
MHRMKIYLPGLCLILLAGCVSTGRFQAKSDQAKRFKAEAAALQAQLTTLTAERDSLLALVGKWEMEHAALLSANQTLQSAMEADKTEKDALILQLTNDRQNLEERLAALEAEYATLRMQIERVKEEDDRRLAELQDTYEDLLMGFQEEIALGQIAIDSLARKLQVHIMDQVLFLSGEAVVRKTGQKILDRVAEVFNNTRGQRMIVEGHTDNVPIGEKLRDRYPTNWELSTTRATNVARYLIEQRGVDPILVSVGGYGEYKPIADNTTPEGRKRNRRIEIILMPIGD